MRPPILDPLNPQSPGFGERLQEGSKNDLETFQQHYNQIQDKYADYPLNNRINDNIAGNYLQDPPAYKPSNLTDLIQSREQWGEDPYAYGQPISFGSGSRGENFERYYKHPNFSKLGFIPGRNNEAVYNENSSWLSDFQRAVPQIMKLTGAGFMDMLSEWTDWGFEPDTKMGETMQKAMSIGNTSRGGLGGWATNFAVNMGYTLGVVADLAIEELALTGLTILAGGTDIEITGPAAVARAASASSKIGSAARATRAWAEAFRIIRTPEQANSFWKASKATAQFLNPLERTAQFAGELGKIKNLAWYAQGSRGAMAFFGDIRMMNAVTSESKLEAGITKLDLNKALVDDFYTKENRLPNEEEAKDLDEIAQRGAQMDALGNVPLIYLSNKIVFDGAMQGSRVLRESAVEAGLKDIAGKTGQILTETHALKPSELVGKWSAKGLRESFKPGNLLKGTLRYTAANLAEGLQEIGQETIHSTLVDYYRQFYNNPTLASLKSSLGHGLINQVSAQGLDTFISGFLMGGAIHGLQKPLFTTLPLLGKRIFAPEAYGKWKEGREQYINNFLNVYNTIKADPKKYVDAFNSTDENFVTQSIVHDHLKSTFNPKQSMDLKDESAFHHVYTLLQNNQLPFLKDLINDYKQMSPEQLREAFGKDLGPDSTGLDIRQRLDNFDKKLGVIETIWDDHVKTHPNPIPIEQARKSNEAAAYHTEFEMYRKLAVFSHYGFERAADRTASILSKAAANKPLSKAFSSDFSVLYSPNDLTDHLRALKQEISLLKDTTDPQGKQDLKSKLKRFDDLSDYQKVLKALQVAYKKKDTTAITDLNINLHSIYKSYLKSIADEYNEPLLDSKTDETFTLVKDFYAVNQDGLDMARAVNMFADPQYVQELLNRIHTVKTELDTEQVNLAKDGLLVTMDRIKNNELINKLFDAGVLISESDPFLTDQTKLPSQFYNATDHTPVSPEKQAEANEIVKIWHNETSYGPPAPVVTPVVTLVTPKTLIKDMPEDLENLLRKAFKEENLRRVADGEPELHVFKKFVTESPIARDIIEAYNKPKNVTIAAPIIVTPGEPNTPSILPEFKGKIIYMTATVGKTFSAQKHPDDLIDGDQLLLDFLIKKGIPNSGSFQNSGLDFWKYLNTHSKEENALIEEFQDFAEDAVKTTGKTLLTGSKYLRPIADKAYLTDDIVRVAKVFRDRGQTRYSEAATKHITENQAHFAELGSEPIGQDVFAEHILTGTLPIKEVPVVPNNFQSRLDQVDTLDELDNLTKDFLQEIAQGKLDAKVAEDAIKAKRLWLVTEVSMNKISKGDILVMTDKKFYRNKGLAEVVEKSETEIKVRPWSATSKKLPTSIRVITEAQLKDQVELVYKDGMTDQDITPPIDPASEAVAKTNEQPSEDLQAKIKARKDNKTHKGDDLFENPEDC